MGLLRRPLWANRRREDDSAGPAGQVRYRVRSRKPVCGFAAIPAFQYEEFTFQRTLLVIRRPGEAVAMTDPRTPTEARWLIVWEHEDPEEVAQQLVALLERKGEQSTTTSGKAQRPLG
jgi:hypothetical protein